MTLYLVDPAFELTLEIDLPGELEQTWLNQLERLDNSKDARRLFEKRLARLLAELLPDALDWDLKPPTSQQLAFAKSLARRLHIEIPRAAMESRGAMHSFLDRGARHLRAMDRQ